MAEQLYRVKPLVWEEQKSGRSVQDIAKTSLWTYWVDRTSVCGRSVSWDAFKVACKSRDHGRRLAEEHHESELAAKFLEAVEGCE